MAPLPRDIEARPPPAPNISRWMSAGNPQDEHDVGPRQAERPDPKPPPARRRKRSDSRVDDDVNDTPVKGHLPLHVENDIADLESLLEGCDDSA